MFTLVQQIADCLLTSYLLSSAHRLDPAPKPPGREQPTQPATIAGQIDAAIQPQANRMHRPLPTSKRGANTRLTLDTSKHIARFEVGK